MTAKQSPTGRPETMTEELEQLLKNLKLRRMLSVYEEQLRAAEKAQASYSEFVAGLLRAQWHDKQDSALEWRASAGPICRNAGRWKRFPGSASPASIASRSAPSLNSTSSPNTRIWY